MIFDSNYDSSACTYCSNHKILEAAGGMGALFLGDVNAALDADFIAANSIRTVVTAAEAMDHVTYSKEIQHIRYPLYDIQSEQISKYFDHSYQVIEEARKVGNILVHCAAGISRSATLVLSYIMRKNNWTFRKAIDFVRAKRSVICPNLGFQRQLKHYETVLLGRGRSNSMRIQSKTSDESRENAVVMRRILPEIGSIQNNINSFGKTQSRKVFSKEIIVQENNNTMNVNGKGSLSLGTTFLGVQGSGLSQLREEDRDNFLKIKRICTPSQLIDKIKSHRDDSLNNYSAIDSTRSNINSLHSSIINTSRQRHISTSHNNTHDYLQQNIDIKKGLQRQKYTAPALSSGQELLSPLLIVRKRSLKQPEPESLRQQTSNGSRVLQSKELKRLAMLKAGMPREGSSSRQNDLKPGLIGERLLFNNYFSAQGNQKQQNLQSRELGRNSNNNHQVQRSRHQ